MQLILLKRMMSVLDLVPTMSLPTIQTIASVVSTCSVRKIQFFLQN